MAAPQAHKEEATGGDGQHPDGDEGLGEDGSVPIVALVDMVGTAVVATHD